jgi:hypothetical protein
VKKRCRLVAIYDTVGPIAEYEASNLDRAAKLSASGVRPPRRVGLFGQLAQP